MGASKGIYPVILTRVRIQRCQVPAQVGVGFYAKLRRQSQRLAGESFKTVG
jgi:hypothetical protein